MRPSDAETTPEAWRRRMLDRVQRLSPGSGLSRGVDPLGDIRLLLAEKKQWRLRRGRRPMYPQAEDRPGDVVAVVGMRFEAKIVDFPPVRAVVLGSDLNVFAAPMLPTDRGIISFGVCGGLAPKLRAGDCIVASAIYDGKAVWPTDKSWTKRLADLVPKAIVGPILGVDAPVLEVADKARLFKQHGAVAVDMESHLAASLASAHGVPFISVRVVLDDAHCELVASAMAGRRVDGSVSIARVLGALVGRPAEIAPLFRLAARANSARSTLLRLRPLLAESLRRISAAQVGS